MTILIFRLIQTRQRLSAQRVLSFFTLMFICACVPAYGADSGEVYDDELPRKTSTVVPPELLEGNLWKLNPEVIPYQGLFQFDVETPWGSYPVYGEAMLRLRLREFRAIDELQGISSTEAAIKGAGTSLKKTAERLGYSVMHPKRAAKEFPQGARRLYRKLARYGNKIVEAVSGEEEETEEQNEELVQSNEASSAEKAAIWLARKYAGVGSKTRNWARDVGVDPYTNNDLLAEELDRVSQAEAIGSVSTKVLLPFTLGALGLAADAVHIAYTTDWRDILVYNSGLMREMGVSEDLIVEFETHDFYTPMTQTLVIAMLDSIEGAKGRDIVIEQAIQLESESEALFFLESVMLAEWYHREQKPLKAFVPNTLIPVAISESDDLVAFTAADYIYWTEETAAVSREFTETYSEYPGGRELIVADFVSPNADKGLAKLGWTVQSSMRLTYDVEVPWGAQDNE
jgi:hypothetical protein